MKETYLVLKVSFSLVSGMVQDKLKQIRQSDDSTQYFIQHYSGIDHQRALKLDDSTIKAYFKGAQGDMVISLTHRHQILKSLKANK